MKPYQKVKIKNSKNGLVEIEGEVPVDVFHKHMEEAIKEIKKDFEAPGFRKGKVPEDIIKKTVNDEQIMGEASKSALQEAYKAIVEDKKDELNIMSAPRANITKIAKGSPLGFKLQVAVVPEIKLSNYKKLAKKAIEEMEKPDISVTDEDVENTIKQLQAMNADEETKEVPELNDEFVKSLGDFKNVDDLKDKIKENIIKEKENREEKKKKNKIAEKLIEEIDIPIADIAIETELSFALERLGSMLKQSKMTIEEYIEKSGKKMEEFIKEEKKHITNQLKSQVLFSKIAEKEGVEVETKEIEEKINQIIMQNPQAAENLESLRDYAERLIKNEKVLEILEKG